MKEKIIYLNQSVYDICSGNPEVIPVLAELGFRDITKPGMLSRAGRFMTLPKGAAMKKISMDKIIEELSNKGYDVKQ